MKDLENSQRKLKKAKILKKIKYSGAEEINKYLEKIIFQREQMGPVNLRAKIEEKEVETTIEEIQLEKGDLEQAIEKLRIAINKINSEGKNRLIVAFEKFNKNFSDLFKKLFNGGEAKLELVKSDTPSNRILKYLHALQVKNYQILVCYLVEKKHLLLFL